MAVHSPAIAPEALKVEKKILDQDHGIMLNGCTAATLSRHEFWSHMHRQDVVHVAPGMDILLVLGVNWIHVDKEAMDVKAAVAAT